MNHEKVIMLADCQSFYASVEKSEHPEYKYKPLAVAGDPERRSGIILAACPIAKSFGVTTADRLGEALSKCPDLVTIKPRMEHYIEVSLLITRIYESYTDLVEPYSIDEQFIDATGVMSRYESPEKLAKIIQRRVLAETGIYTRFGISTNKILAKTACDNFAKKNKTGICTLLKEDLENTLWKLPIEKMFMVGGRMKKHFIAMGFQTIGDLANTSLDTLKLKMRRKMGKNFDINAEMYWRIANGIDDSPVSPQTIEGVPKSFGNMMTLPHDYKKIDEIKVVLLELTEIVCQRARSSGFMANVVSVSCMGANFDYPTGFDRQQKMIDPTNVTNTVFFYVMELFKKYWDGHPIRKVGIGVSQLVPDNQYQLSWLDPYRERMIALEKTTDAIKSKYGDTSIMRAVSATDAGQAMRRSEMIGGHYK